MTREKINSKRIKKGRAPSCPCQSGEAYAQCCEPLHLGEHPRNGEAVMRSRYSAFVLGLEVYLLSSWHEETRPESLTLSPEQQWFYLKIIEATQGEHCDEYYVTFEARYRENHQVYKMCEKSHFIKDSSGILKYIDGQFIS
ncbi:YchJ family protein [Ignatzschineria cameli]|uniref:YchJ family protein n=1 Tax=Ignatzschineria cameli TaxID=2182793 RepID=UPI001300A17C|nr:YchJ family metal-binding protein [Ignatzschineria cameli]